MIWRWLICSSLLAGSAAAVEITGSVRLSDSSDAAVRKSQDFSGVVISLVPAQTPAAAPPARRARMVQKNKTFTPHVLAIETGTTVDFPNYDPIFHNAFSSYSGQIFDIGLYPPGQSRAVKFARPGVVRVFCNIHPAMSAVIVVLATPYFATTNKAGEFKLDVPAGAYQLEVFHERSTEATLHALSSTVKVGSEPQRLAPVALSEAGYLPQPHHDKHGHPYPPEAGDGIYPGVRK